jgi:hypothetical protein
MSISAIGGQSGFDPSGMATRLFRKADTNGDGGIDQDEFKKLLSEGPGSQTATTDVEQRFSEADVNGDGKISRTENEDSLKKMGVQGGRPAGGKGGGGPKGAGATGGASSSSGIYDEKDTNKDGVVSAAEELAYTLAHPNSGNVSLKTTESQSAILDLYT